LQIIYIYIYIYITSTLGFTLFIFSLKKQRKLKTTQVTMNSTNLNKTGEIWPEIFRGALIGEIKARGVSTFLKFKGKVGQTSERVLHVGLRPWCRRTPQPIWHPSSLIIPLAIFNFQFSIPPYLYFSAWKEARTCTARSLSTICYVRTKTWRDRWEFSSAWLILCPL
jgi:hypothetical protein